MSTPDEYDIPMNDFKSPLLQRPDYLVCTCMGMMHSDIVAAIEHGATTFEQLSKELLVGTGCSSCVDEVCMILNEQLKQRNSAKK